MSSVYKTMPGEVPKIPHIPSHIIPKYYIIQLYNIHKTHQPPKAPKPQTPKMKSTQQIQMSHPADWQYQNNLHNNMSIDIIPPSIYKNVCHILGQSPFSRGKYKKKLLTNTSFLYISPISVGVSLWNFVVIFVVYFLEFQISLTLGFGPQFWSTEIQKTVYHTIYIGLVIMLAIDLLINFNKGYYAFGEGRVIDDKYLIMKRYLKSYFTIDIISIGLLLIPLFYINYFLNYLQIVPMILMYIKKFKCQAEIKQSLQYRRTLRIIFTLGMLGCDVLLLGNFGACIFLGIDLLLWRVQFFGDNTQYYWLSNDSSYSVNLMDGPSIQQYIYAQSFSTGTLSTLAPGPFGKNPIEITYQLFVMIFFMILASYVAEVLISILYGNWQVRIFHQNNIQKFDSFMSLKGVVMKIKTRIHNFFQLIWQFQIKNDAEGEQLLIDKLPFSLKQDLVSQLGFSSQLKFVDYFSNPEDIQRTIAFKITSNIVDPDATLFQVGCPFDTVGQGHVMFIKNGLAKFYFPFHDQKNIVSLSNTQKLMGQYQFITGLSFAFNCKSIDLSVIQKIHYSDFMSIIRNFNLIQQFFVLRCKLMFYNQLDILGRTCLICDKYHRENQCTELMIHEDVRFQLKNMKNIYQELGFKRRRQKVERKARISKKVLERKYQKLQFIEKIHRKQEQYQRVVTDLNQISDQVASFSVYYADFNLFF